MIGITADTIENLLFPRAGCFPFRLDRAVGQPGISGLAVVSLYINILLFPPWLEFGVWTGHLLYSIVPFFSNLSLFSTRACASRLFTLRLYLLLSLQIDISQSSPTKPLASCYQHFHYDSYLFPLSPPCFGPSHYLETIRQPTRINSSPK